jgi:hypothetical protein
VPANAPSAPPVGANAPESIPPCPSPFLPPVSNVSASGQSQFSPKSKQITLDDLAPFHGVAYAKETMPEPYCAMLEKRIYLPLPVPTHKNVHDLPSVFSTITRDIDIKRTQLLEHIACIVH